MCFGRRNGRKNGSAIVSKNFKENFNPVVVIGEGGAGMKNINFLSRHKSFLEFQSPKRPCCG